ncbi:MAG: hypothetical protein ACREAO_05870 [Nitrososphaera sp.]
MRYDIWVTPGREETVELSQGQQVKVRNYYGSIDGSNYDPATKTIEFSMPFNWTSDLVNRVGMLHTEVFIPKSMSDFDRESLDATVNGISVPVVVDTYSPDSTIVHFTVSRTNLEEIAGRVVSENRMPYKAVFTLSPPSSEVKVVQVAANSQNYKVALAWPEQMLPGQPVTFGIRMSDKFDAPVSAATYEMVIIDDDGTEVTRVGGVTTPEGLSSQDVTFASQGSFTIRIEKINASSESIQSGVTVVPEFAAGTAAVVAAFVIGMTVAVRKIHFLSGMY